MKKSRTDMIFNLSLVALIFAAVIIVENIPGVNPMLSTVLKKGSIYALVAVSMNLLNGFTGLFSLGQAGFMLLGAYTYAVITIPDSAREKVYMYVKDGSVVSRSWFDSIANGLHLPEGVSNIAIMIIGMIAGGLIAAFFSWLIGLPVLKLKSDYLAIATLGFAEIIRAIFQWDKLGPVTNGSNVLRNFPTFKTAVFPLTVSAICILFIVLLINSTYGRAFKAIRDDEIAAEAMGINLAHHKRLAFVISSFFAGIGGALLAMFQNTLQATPFKSAMTYEILLIVVIGGIGSISGSIIASFLYISASEWWLRGLDSGKFLFIESPAVLRGGFRMVVFSVIIMIIVLFFRKGIMGERELSITRFLGFFRKKDGKKEENN
ncbi:MAG: branched-chain amino acid ABC transporter permease [Clostridiales bacterium]|nr:branched-chain amino acid ABC transporter permease [Clostridiales bacterium]